MRWIDTRHLDDWADRIDARSRLSELLGRLLRSSVNSAAALRFPSGDDSEIPGFDGVLRASPADGFERFVPEGDSVWEFGVDRVYLKKANSDYDERTHPQNAKKGGQTRKSAPAPVDPATQIDRSTTTFVFVTPRRWSRKGPTLDEWVRGKRAEGVWADVRVIDGVLLADWLEQSTAVAARVAREIVGNYPSSGAVSTDEFWNEYSHEFEPALDADVVLAGRAQQATQLLQALSGGQQLLRWKGDFLIEPIAFAVAAIRRADPRLRRHLESRTLILDTKEAARQLSGQSNLIFFTRESASDLAGSLSDKNPVLVPIGRESRSALATTLERPSTDEMAESLAAMRFSPDRARQLARESGRSLAVLARRIPSANARKPYWAGDPSLIPALIVGAWDSSSALDQGAIVRIAQTADYLSYEQKIRGLLSRDDSPLERTGTVWAVRAPVDLFVNMAVYLGVEHRDLLAGVAAEVFTQTDPTASMTPEERFLDSVRETAPRYSNWIREGVATTLLIISALGEPSELVFGSESPQHFVNRVVQSLPGLRNDPRVIASLSENLPLLMEAAPDPLLSALAHLLLGDGGRAKNWFQDAKSEAFLFASSPHTGVLWALEVAAWDPLLLGRAASLLVRLAEVDPGGRLSNRPLNSLRQILLPWHPQTNASMRQRVAVVDHILASNPDVGWKLLVKLLPQGYDVGGQTPKPRFKEAGASAFEKVTRQLLDENYRELISRALERADSPAKWAEILKIVHAFPAEEQLNTISAIERLVS